MESINFISVVKNKDKIWGIKSCDPYLYCIEEGEYAVKQYCKLYDEEDNKEYGCGLIVSEDTLFVLPCRGKPLLQLFFKDFTIKRFNIPAVNYYIGTSKFDFLSGYVNGEFIFLFGHAYPGIVKVNLLTGEIIIFSEWVQKCLDDINDKHDGFFHVQYTVIDDKVYLPFLNMNAVLCFSPQEESIEIIYFGGNTQRYITSECDGANLWLFPRDGHTGYIAKWCIRDGSIKYFKDYPVGYIENSYAFFRSVLYHKKIYVFSHLGNKGICVNVVNEEISPFDDLYDVSNMRGCNYSFVSLDEGRIFYFGKGVLGYWIPDLGKNEISEYSVGKEIMRRWESKNVIEKMRKAYNDKSTCGEGIAYCLDIFLNYIVGKDCAPPDVEVNYKKKTFGEIVFKKCILG